MFYGLNLFIRFLQVKKLAVLSKQVRVFVGCIIDLLICAIDMQDYLKAINNRKLTIRRTKKEDEKGTFFIVQTYYSDTLYNRATA